MEVGKQFKLLQAKDRGKTFHQSLLTKTETTDRSVLQSDIGIVLTGRIADQLIIYQVDTVSIEGTALYVGDTVDAVLATPSVADKVVVDVGCDDRDHSATSHCALSSLAVVAGRQGSGDLELHLPIFLILLGRRMTTDIQGT